MSLYGSGRSEGFGAVLVLGAIVCTVLAIGSLQVFGLEADLRAALRGALVPALAAATFYRFLRAQRRSRYAAFVVSAGYALSPWLLALAQSPREQLAAALAPLALEAASRCDRPSQRRQWLPWTGACVAAPWLAGQTTIGVLAAVLCLGLLVRLATCGDRTDAAASAISVGAATVLAAATGAALFALDPLAAWLASPAVGALDVLHGHHAGAPGLDVAAIVRVPGPVLCFFALLGVLRKQRHVSPTSWLALAAAGSLPTVLVTLVPAGALGFEIWHEVENLPATAWWLLLLGIAVLAAAGLDDFLDLPLRRRTALPWLLAFAVFVGPMIPFASSAPQLEWPLAASLLLLALMMPMWRRLGILQWKNVLAVAAVALLSLPALQVLPVEMPLPIGAAPAGELARWKHLALRLPPEAPRWPYAVVAVVLLVSSIWALSAFLRSTPARSTPSSARAAIVKKARPSQRS